MQSCFAYNNRSPKAARRKRTRKVFMHVSEEQREAYKKAGEARRAEQAKVKEKLKKKD